jgi:DNA-binding CsgD family transcriptional regulator
MSLISKQFERLFGSAINESLPLKNTSSNYKTASRYNTTFFLDLTSLKYGYMNENCRQLTGYSSNYLIGGGVDSYVSLWPSKGIELYANKIVPATIVYLSAVPASRASDYVFGRTYFIKTKQGEVRKIFERDFFLYHPSSPVPIAVEGYATDITSISDKNSTIFFIEDSSKTGRESLVHKEVIFDNEEQQILSPRELEVLLWMADGYSSKQIADKMQISVHTINNHRKRMLYKTNSTNSVDLLSFAVKNDLL